MKETYFHIERLIELLQEQYPERTDLVESVKKSKHRMWIRQPYIHFVSAINPNSPGSKWQFIENIVLEDDIEGTIILDVLKDGKVGGIEFVDQIKD